MNILAPDDFAGRPYEGGLNQMGHVIAGAAVVGVLSTVVSPHVALLIGGLLIIAWEGWQLHRMGATGPDYWADLAYWMAGAWAWTWVISDHPDVSLAPLLPCAAFVVEYSRLKVKA